MQAQGMWSAGDGDDNRRFLADLRALRDTAALEFDELAARAHYPSDVLKEAESGPSLPTLPILAAYVRACDGDVPEWEERWRRLGFEVHADPGLPVRAVGASPAAVAGARAGVGVAPPESYDAERIRAVLRGAHGSSGRGASGTASRKSAPAASAGAGSAGAGWDTGTSADTVGGWRTDTGAGWDTDTGAGWDTGSHGDARADTSWSGFQPDAGPHWDGAAADVPDVGPGW
ncbi:MAG TPA: helix-turn-helix transcriptional regulator, partial [Streptosporangiaceae bacterium]|nr:helix-turn-helix transcriptional regulator [Streptosporangiaceae bacterium]